VRGCKRGDLAVSPRGMSDYAERFGSAADAAAAISTSIPVAAFTSNFFMITLRALGVRQTIMERIRPR
jgi:hypothetical protein